MVLSAHQQPRRVWLRHLWQEHGLPLLLYGLISLGVTWPLPRFFTSQIPGESYDAYNGLWVMWHVKEWVLGHQPLYDLPLLYYPAGATLLSHVPGPLTGFFALPFWPLGPEAAHNGAVLISFTLTGYFMYLLARALKLARPVAFFAGLLLLLAPMHLAGLRGHTTKVFLGTVPLVLFCLVKALDPEMRERRALLWAAATGAALLFTMLHHSLQFIMAGMALALIGIVALWRARRDERLRVLRRLAVAAAASLLFTGPLLLATARAAYAPDLRFDFNIASFDFQPDLVEFLLPPVHSLLFGRGVADFLFGYDIGPGIETAVSLSLVVLLLVAVAVVKGGHRARMWAAFSLLWVVLAMGPAVRLLNETLFTEYRLPVILPYSFLTELPGLDFLRTPGRFMQMGYVGLAVTAALGLAWLRQRWPRRATALPVVMALLVLVENWPRPWPMMTLRPVPSFYETLAQDPQTFGVLDLPVTANEDVPPIMYNANYQAYQMIHGKGIPMGYISRTYSSHPLFPCLYDPPRETPDVLVDGQPSPCAFHPLYDLPRYGYRYVVIHKPQEAYLDYVPGSEGALAAADFVEQYLNEQAPIADDALATVYAMPAEADVAALPTALALGQGWHDLEEANGVTWRWAESPAALVITTPRDQPSSLELVPAALHNPQAGDGTATEGSLLVEIEGEVLHEVPVALGQRAFIPLSLPAGSHTVTLRLQAGNFSPAAQGQPDPRTLSFAVEALNLVTVSSPSSDS